MASSGPVRTCVACRKRGGKGELVKLADTPSGVMPDYTEKLPGRGAYVCAEPDCIKGALDGRVLSRAFKKKTDAPDYQEFTGLLADAIERRIRSLLGMARKSGRAAHGFDAAVEQSGKRPGGIMVVASDLSDGTARRLKADVAGTEVCEAGFLTKDEMGTMFGTAPVGVVYISDKGLAAALAMEFGRFSKINRG